MFEMRKPKQDGNEFALVYTIPKGSSEIKVYEKGNELKVVTLWLN